MANEQYPRGSTSRLLRLLHLCVWLFIFALSWAAFIKMMPLGDSFFRAVLNTGLLAVLFYGTGMTYRYYYERRKYWQFGTGLVIVFAVVTIIRFYVNRQFSYLEDASLYYTPDAFSFFIGALVTNIGTLLISLLYQLVRSRIRLKQRETALLAEQREAKIQFLRAQMNPHFLFNTLNNIYSLAVVKSEKTAPLVLRLSDLLRYVIYDAQQEKVPLAKEITILEEYIELFQLQYEEQKDITFTYQLPRKGYLIEPLLLIPLVENCFKHSDLAENENGYVHLELLIDEDEMMFSAKNSFNPFQSQKDEQGGVGLENIRRRLALQYPGHYQLIEEKSEDHFRIQLAIKKIK
jgi:sensor histidine kinase YesM